MDRNTRRRRRPQLPSSASNIPPPRGSRPLEPPQSGRIPFDDGLQQLFSVCRPGPAVRRAQEAWCDGDCDVWCDGKLVDPGRVQLVLGVDVSSDDDGREQFKPWAVTDMMPDGSRATGFASTKMMCRDQSDRNWEISTVAVAVLRKELSPNTEQIAPALPPVIRIEGPVPVQLLESSPSQTKAQSPSQPTDAQLEEWVNDASLPPAHKEIRRFTVKEFGSRDWKSVSTTAIRKAAKDSAEFKKRVHPLPSENTFNRALERKKS